MSDVLVSVKFLVIPLRDASVVSAVLSFLEKETHNPFVM